MQRILQAIVGSSLAVACAAAGSNVDPEHRWSESDFIGQLDWRPGAEHGAAINQYYCSGHVFGPQVGWIRLGSGAPADGVRYRNDAAGDFGVNVLPGGELRGFAYGANIGWIGFEQSGNPRVDWNTGQLSGAAYAANAGWIWLDQGGASVRVESIGEPPDLDNDGLPDAWEISRAGSLAALGSDADADLDGQTDWDEFLAGTNPLDMTENLGPVVLVERAPGGGKAIQWPGQAGHLYLVEKRSSFEPGSVWQAVNSTPLAGVRGAMELALAASEASSGYFRVRAFPPLSKIN
jgi:hypothetical protein